MITSIAEHLATTKAITKTCRECGNNFELLWPSLARLVQVCPECSERHAEEDQRRIVENSSLVREENWKHRCPYDFRATDRAKLPNKPAAEKALAWKYGSRGLLLVGFTGLGKSRVLWLIGKREYLAKRSVAVLDCESGLIYASKYSQSSRDVQQWIDGLLEVDLLLMDDVFKSKLTDSFESALFTIISGRTERGKPIILSTNDTGSVLINRLSPDRGEPMVRRLREFCASVSF